ncbi:MAG: hypothetical protein JSW15_03540 [Deltaproteobacteria bacterium]|nr:MAG: hypothetical protein JSW15_03540 [Deltaproteobacteria bacterium]
MAGKFKLLKELGLDEPALSVEEYRKMGRDEEWDYVQNKYPFVPPSFLGKIDYQRRGVAMTRAAVEKVQDPYYAQGPRILFQWHHEDFKETYSIPFCMKLNDSTTIAMQICPEDVGDPYTIDLIDDKFWILSGDKKKEEIDFFKASNLEREGKTTRKGVPLTHIGWQSGSSCMLIIPNSHCQYWNNGNQCRFCDMDYNTRQAMKMGRGWKVRLNGDDVYDLISEALKEKGRWLHMLITGGSNPKENFERELKQEIEIISAIKKASEPYKPYDMTTYLVATPVEDDQYRRLKDAGLDAFGGYFETWTKDKWELVCPGKAENIPYDTYLERVLNAVKIFGEGNVGAGFVIGTEMAPPPYGFEEVDEAVNSTLEGYDFLLSNSVVPVGTNWCINPGTDFYKMGAVQPPLEFYVKIDIGRYRLLKKHHNGRLSGDFMEWKFQPLGLFTDWQRLL